MNAGFATYRGEDGWEFLTDQMRDMLAAFGGALVAAERERIASLWAGCYTDAEGHGRVDIGASIRAGALVDDA